LDAVFRRLSLLREARRLLAPQLPFAYFGEAFDFVQVRLAPLLGL
jgi:hypothetical protein